MLVVKAHPPLVIGRPLAAVVPPCDRRIYSGSKIQKDAVALTHWRKARVGLIVGIEPQKDTRPFGTGRSFGEREPRYVSLDGKGVDLGGC